MFRKGGTSAAFLINKTRKVHTTFKDGSELVEEYDAETQRIISRKRRRPTATGAAGAWEVLLGDPQPRPAPDGSSSTTGLLMQESNTNPQCVRVDTPGHFTWKISNLPYPSDTYSVLLDEECCSIVVATSNKKYFKRLALPEMKLLQLVLEPSRMSWSYQGSTLIVHYSKPPALIAEELADAKAAAAMRLQENPADCRQQ